MAHVNTLELMLRIADDNRVALKTALRALTTTRFVWQTIQRGGTRRRRVKLDCRRIRVSNRFDSERARRSKLSLISTTVA
jgi:hypothetical protein